MGHVIPGLPPAADVLARLLIAVASAVLLAYLAPPANLHWLQWFAYIPMLLILRPQPEGRTWRGWFASADTWIVVVYAVVGQGSIFFWIAQTIARFEENIPFAVALAILGLFSIVFGLPYMLLWWATPALRRRLGTWWVLAFPALMVVIEFVGMWVILFPYNQGVGQYRVPSTFQLVSVTGIWGMTWLVLFVNAAIAEVILAWREGRGRPLAWIGVAAGTWGLVNLWGAWQYRQVEAELADAPTLRLLQIQDDIDMLDRMRSPPCVTWNYWYDASASVQPGQVDLIVWSEGGSVYPLNLPRPRARNYRGAPCEDITEPAQRLQALADRLGAELLVGSAALEMTVDPDGTRRRRALNSVYHFTPDGEMTRYDKLVPLPFGEYLPLADTFPFLRDWFQGPGNFMAGTEAVVFQGSKASYGTPICYEAILPHVCRRFEGADVLVNGTLDTWFGDTAAPHQHAMLAVVRAYELGRPLIRSAYTGVSLVAEPHGRIVAETPPYEEVTRIVEVRLGKVQTIYRTLAGYGLQDWFAWLCVIGLTVGWLIAPRLRADSGSPRTGGPDGGAA